MKSCVNFVHTCVTICYIIHSLTMNFIPAPCRAALYGRYFCVYICSAVMPITRTSFAFYLTDEMKYNEKVGEREMRNKKGNTKSTIVKNLFS